MPWRLMELWDVEAPTFTRQSAHRRRWGCQPYAPSYPCDKLWRRIGLWDVEAPTFSRQSAHRWQWACQPNAPAGCLLPPGRFLVLFSVRGWVDPRAMVQLERWSQLKNPIATSRIVPATFRLVAQCLDQLRYIKILHSMHTRAERKANCFRSPVFVFVQKGIRMSEFTFGWQAKPSQLQYDSWLQILLNGKLSLNKFNMMPGRGELIIATCFMTVSFFYLSFYIEDGCRMFLRNFSWLSTDYTAL
jgi:hypothetical protein